MIDLPSHHLTEQDDYNISQLPPVHQAAARGHVDRLVKMVARDPSNLEYYSEDGMTPKYLLLHVCGFALKCIYCIY